MKQLKAPKESLGDLDADMAARLVAAAADVVLVIDRQGVIRDAAVSGRDLVDELAAGWVGRAWIDTVTVESRPKVEMLMREAGAVEAPRWRHLNHPTERGADVPVLYSAIELGGRGRIVAVGRDLRATAALQQRLIDVQQSMERDYSRLRHLEMRYRLLFDLTAEAVLVVEAGSRRVLEANPAAGRLLGEADARLGGRMLTELVEPASVTAVEALLATVRATGRPDEVRARLAGEAGAQVAIAASLFRQESTALLLVRLSPLDAAASAVPLPATRAQLLAMVDRAPDAIVLADAEGRVLSANAAFLDLAQLPTEEQARGESLDRWLGRAGVDLAVLVANLRQHGVVRLFATTMRGDYGGAADIEVSAVALEHEGLTCLGFTIRDVGRRPAAEPRGGRELPRSVEQLAELVGRVPLKDLVRQTTDVIERLCIEAALELTGDNRASAAEILGLSRQSLYVKLRRYGLGDLAEAEE